MSKAEVHKAVLDLLRVAFDDPEADNEDVAFALLDLGYGLGFRVQVSDGENIYLKAG